MAAIRCEVKMCPFRDSRNWCTARVITIGAHGGCLNVYKRDGDTKMIEMNIPPWAKEQIKIVDADGTNCSKAGE